MVAHWWGLGGDEWFARCNVSPNLTLENRLTNCSLEICVPKPPSMGFWGFPRARVRPAGLAPPARRPQLPQPNSARFWGSNHATHAPNSLPVTCADVFPISWHIFVREGHKTVSPTRPPHPHAPTSCGVPMHPERELCAMSSWIRCEKCSPGAALHGTPPLLPPAACMMWCFVREMGEKLGRR